MYKKISQIKFKDKRLIATERVSIKEQLKDKEPNKKNRHRMEIGKNKEDINLTSIHRTKSYQWDVLLISD